MREIKLREIQRIVIGVDPPGGVITECGIIIAGLGDDGHGYVLEDKTLAGTPGEWSSAVIDGYISWNADCVVGEDNFGGTMVEQTIAQTAKDRDCDIQYKNVHATRGKAVRAEPIVAAYEHGRVHHVGTFPHLEEEMVMWTPGISHFSPNRIDALVWAITELELRKEVKQQVPNYYIPDLSRTSRYHI